MSTSTGTLLPLTIPDREFDVRTNDAELRIAERSSRAMLAICVGAFFVFGPAFAAIGLFRSEWVFAGMGIAMGLAGVYFAFRWTRNLGVQTHRLKVSQVGLMFVGPKGVEHLVPWSRPGLKGSLIDCRGQAPGGYRYSKVPCVLNVDGRHAGIPGEAFDAILGAVRSLGIPSAQVPRHLPPVTLFGDLLQIGSYRPFR